MVQPLFAWPCYSDCPCPALSSTSMSWMIIRSPDTAEKEEEACLGFNSSWFMPMDFLIAKKHGPSATPCVTSLNLLPTMFPAQHLTVWVAEGLESVGYTLPYNFQRMELHLRVSFCSLLNFQPESCNLVSVETGHTDPYSLWWRGEMG